MQKPARVTYTRTSLPPSIFLLLSSSILSPISFLTNLNRRKDRTDGRTNWRTDGRTDGRTDDGTKEKLQQQQQLEAGSCCNIKEIIFGTVVVAAARRSSYFASFSSRSLALKMRPSKDVKNAPPPEKKKTFKQPLLLLGQKVLVLAVQRSTSIR